MTMTETAKNKAPIKEYLQRIGMSTGAALLGLSMLITLGGNTSVYAQSATASDTSSDTSETGPTIGYTSGTASSSDTSATGSSTAANSPDYETSSFQAGQLMYRHGGYGEVRGYIQVPKVTCKGSDNFALWLGIGDNTRGDGVAQAGVVVQCTNHGAAKYHGFYAMYPKNTHYPSELAGKVRAGDEFIVDVAYQLHGKYAISLTDQRNGANFGGVNLTFPKGVTDSNRQALALGERVQAGVSQPPVPKFSRILFSKMTSRETPTSAAKPFGHLGTETRMYMMNSNYTYPVVPSKFNSSGYAFYLYNY
jgi:hypothetical protein